MSEPQFDVDAAQEQFEAAQAENADAPIIDDPALDPDLIEVEELDGDDQPPGFKSYEDYVADGGDQEGAHGKRQPRIAEREQTQGQSHITAVGKGERGQISAHLEPGEAQDQGARYEVERNDGDIGEGNPAEGAERDFEPGEGGEDQARHADIGR